VLGGACCAAACAAAHLPRSLLHITCSGGESSCKVPKHVINFQLARVGCIALKSARAAPRTLETQQHAARRHQPSKLPPTTLIKRAGLQFNAQVFPTTRYPSIKPNNRALSPGTVRLKTDQHRGRMKALKAADLPVVHAAVGSRMDGNPRISAGASACAASPHLRSWRRTLFCTHTFLHGVTLLLLLGLLLQMISSEWLELHAGQLNSLIGGLVASTTAAAALASGRRRTNAQAGR